MHPHYHQRYDQFDKCENLATVDLVGGDTQHHLLVAPPGEMQRWRDAMNQEIDRIIQELPHTVAFTKTAAMRQWIESVLERMRNTKKLSIKHY